MLTSRLRRLIRPFFLAAAALTTVSWILKGELVEPDEIHPDLLQEPRQHATSRSPFSFSYTGRQCAVRPVASYELWGLVVSHNNIRSMADIYHDSSSVDTKDLCVIWGANLESPDYRRVDYTSGPWTCYFSYPEGVQFRHRAIGNNHLITDDPAIRERLGRIRVGDQVRMAGLLVDYQMEDWGTFWRQTSTRRDDTDCEVVFLEELEVLRRGTPGWYATYRAGWAALLGLPILYLVLVWIEAGQPGSGQLGRL